MGKVLDFFRRAQPPAVAHPPEAGNLSADRPLEGPAPRPPARVRSVDDNRGASLDLTAHPLVRDTYEGEEVSAAGYVFAGHQPGWTPKQAVILEVRGVTFGDRVDVLQMPCLAPLSEVRLRREPDNSRDPRAIAVDTADGQHVGYLPAEFSAGVAPLLDRGHKAAAIVTVEWRRNDDGSRCGLRLLVAAGVERIEYRVISPDVYD
jgi:hypothetical protein